MIPIERLRALIEREAEFSAIRSQGSGGQNVNKVSSTIHLRLDLSTLPLTEPHKARLLALGDQRISDAGVLVLKAQNHRSQPMNREDAIARALELVLSVATAPRRRIATRPTRGSQQRRVEEKRQRSETKASRGRLNE
ncbi:MAG: hypothetical protein RLZZ598_1575 [Pseudomonadota bacterium]|jgi:ribosome-associated protein